MKPLGQGRVLNLLPLLIGALAFFMVIGPRALDPQNIAWLGNGDPATHYLGWLFYRQSPWSFPIGLNPSYGLELSNSIIFSDSNPLLAFVFKPFASLLPEPFQYFGLWLLACFMLQAWFAWKLVGLITPSIAIRALGAALFLFVPPMILRMTVHLSLGGHFLVLAALYLNLHPALRRRRMAWGALLAAAALIHAYFLAMIALIWLADLAAKYFKRRLSLGSAAIELGVLFSLVTACCWQAGYFTVERAGVTSAGFGLYRANVLTLFNPQNWSYALKNLPGVPGDSDGFAFLGTGLIVLSICAFAGWLRGNTGLGSALYKRPMLGLALIGLTIFSFSNHVAIGSFELGYSLPPSSDFHCEHLSCLRANVLADLLRCDLCHYFPDRSRQYVKNGRVSFGDGALDTSFRHSQRLVGRQKEIHGQAGIRMGDAFCRSVLEERCISLPESSMDSAAESLPALAFCFSFCRPPSFVNGCPLPWADEYDAMATG